MSLFDSLLAHLGAFGADLSALPTQNARLIRLHTPLGPDALVAETLDVDEAIGPLPDKAADDATDDLSPFGLSLSKPPAAGTRLIVHALSGSTYLDVAALTGQPVLVELLTAHSTTALRPWHGHLTAIELVGSDGGLARYRLVIEPWLAALAHRQDSYVFHDQTVIDIIDELFADYQGQGTLTPQWRWDLADPTVYPKRSLSRQHQESDLTFIHRLLREEGLFYWWEHSADGDGQHTLVIADHNGAFPVARQARVRYTQSGATLSEDSLTRVASQAAVHPARLELASADYRRLDLRALSTNTNQGNPSSSNASTAPGLDTLIQRDVPCAYAYEDSAQGQRLLQRQSEALDAQRHQFHTTGSVRTAAAGTTFTLSDHLQHDGLDTTRDQFVILRARHHARNNLHADHAAQIERRLGPLPDRLGAATGDNPAAQTLPSPSRTRGPSVVEAPPLLHHCTLLLQPAALPVRCCNLSAEHGLAVHGAVRAPTRALPDIRLHPRPSVDGLHTARVIGLADDAVHSDRDQRIKVQFHWQRGSRSGHRLDHPSGADNAPGDASGVASTGTWLRVATPIAGANWGGHFTPRLGQEVLVAFHDGDIDRAVVVGSAYNGQGQVDAPGNQSAGAAAPAWFQGEKAATHPAALSGLKSQELPSSASGTGGYNHLVFDDSPKAERIELGTSQAGSRLQLGRLTYQQDNQLGVSAQARSSKSVRAEPFGAAQDRPVEAQSPAARGHGAELATHAWGALRAGSGLLLSSHGYTDSIAGGQQLEARPAQARLQQGHELLHTLAQSAQAHNAKLTGEAPLGDAVPDSCNASSSLPVERALAATQTSLAEEQTLGGSDSSTVRPEPVEGQDNPSTEAPTIGGGQGRVPAWGRPDLVLASPAGILQSSPASGLLSVGQTTALVAGHDLNQISQGRWSLTAKDGIVLYTYGQVRDAKKPNQETGIQLHAARGNVSSQSQSGATRLIADQNVSLCSTQADIKAASPTTFLLTAGGAGITLTGGQITLTASGNITLKAGQKVLEGGASVNAGSLTFPRTTLLLNPKHQAKYPISI